MFKQHWKLDENRVVLDMNFMDKYYGKSHVLTNLRTLHGVNEQINAGEEVNDEKEAMIILDILTKLGYNITNMDIKVDRENFTVNMNKVMQENLLFTEWKNYRYMLDVKEYRMNELKEKCNIKKFLGLINSLLNSYGNNIKLIENFEGKTINKKRIWINKSTYICNYIDNINKYI